VVVSGGGVLSQIGGRPRISPTLDYPARCPLAEPRSAPFMVPVLLTLSRLGLVPNVVPSLEVALASLRRRGMRCSGQEARRRPWLGSSGGRFR